MKTINVFTTNLDRDSASRLTDKLTKEFKVAFEICKLYDSENFEVFCDSKETINLQRVKGYIACFVELSSTI